MEERYVEAYVYTWKKGNLKLARQKDGMTKRLLFVLVSLVSTLESSFDSTLG